MDGTTVLIIFFAGNSIMLTATVFVIKRLSDSTVKRVMDNCKIISGNIVKRLDEEVKIRAKDDQEVWDAFNKHGHKGLNGNDARVTR